MTATASAGPSVRGTQFGAGRLLAADSRMAFALLNHGRHRLVHRFFGVSPEQANVLTVVLALGAADAAFETMRRVAHAPLGLSRSDAALGGFALREAALGIAGPQSRTTPIFGTLLAAAIVGGAVLPALREATRGARATEQRVRRQRIGRYTAA